MKRREKNKVENYQATHEWGAFYLISNYFFRALFYVLLFYFTQFKYIFVYIYIISYWTVYQISHQKMYVQMILSSMW